MKKVSLSPLSQKALNTLHSESKRILDKGNSTEDREELRSLSREMDLLVEAIRKLEYKVSFYHSHYNPY